MKKLNKEGGFSAPFKSLAILLGNYDDAQYVETVQVLVHVLFHKENRDEEIMQKINPILEAAETYDADETDGKTHVEELEEVLELLYDTTAERKNFKDTEIEKYSKATKSRLVKRVEVILTVRKIRQVLMHQCFIGIAGTQNAGKTTLINKLLNKNFEAGLAAPTTKVITIPIDDLVTFVDTPGTTSMENHSRIFANIGAMYNLIVLVVPFEGAVSTIVVEAIKLLRGTSSTKVIICNNRCGHMSEETMCTESGHGKDAFKGVLEGKYREKLRRRFSENSTTSTQGGSNQEQTTSRNLLSNAVATMGCPGTTIGVDDDALPPRRNVSNPDADPALVELLDNSVILFTDWKISKEERLATGIDGVDRVRKEIRKFLDDFNVYQGNSDALNKFPYINCLPK